MQPAFLHYNPLNLPYYLFLVKFMLCFTRLELCSRLFRSHIINTDLRCLSQRFVMLTERKNVPNLKPGSEISSLKCNVWSNVSVRVFTTPELNLSSSNLIFTALLLRTQATPTNHQKCHTLNKNKRDETNKRLQRDFFSSSFELNSDYVSKTL